MDIFGEITDMRILSVARIHRQLFAFTTFLNRTVQKIIKLLLLFIIIYNYVLVFS
jgi:hypothetical protein